MSALGTDAGTDGPSAADAQSSPDAVPLPDAPPYLGQKASLVLCQPDFDSSGELGPSLSACSSPRGIAWTGSALWVADFGYNRILGWSSPPTTNMAPASLVLGQADGKAIDGHSSAAGLKAPYHIRAAGSMLLVADANNNRVVIWNNASATGAAASRVLGQATFDTSVAGTGASGMSFPTSVWSDGQRVAVADFNNDRVLLWNKMPTTDGAPADVVLGAADFSKGSGSIPPTASSMRSPLDVYSDGTRLFVVDSGDNRILVWNEFPTANNAPASFVLGQTTFAGQDPNSGGPATGLDYPQALVADDSGIYVADLNNHRVVGYTPRPTASGARASVVFGQADVDSVGASVTEDAARMMHPVALALSDKDLFVADKRWPRVLRFARF